MKSRGPYLFLILLILVMSGLLVFFLYNSKEFEKREKTRFQTELSSRMEELADKETQLANLTKQKQEMEDQLNAMIASLEMKSKEAEKEARSWSEKASSLESENRTLTSEIRDQADRIEELSEKIEALEEQKESLTKKLGDVENKKSPGYSGSAAKPAVNPDAAFIRPAVDAVKLGKIIVQKNTGKTTNVQHVDGLYGFIVINAGSEEGLHKNSVINIVRDQNIIGKAVVQKVRVNNAAALLIPEWTKDEIKPGDLVTLF